MDRLRVVVSIPEREALLTERGARVELTFDALPGSRIEGKVARTGVALDPKSRTMRVEIDLPNPNSEYRPGMFGSATIRLKKSPHSLRVPRSALVSPPGPAAIFGVYVVRNGKAHLTAVVQGFERGTEVEILKGLSSNDQVVADPRGLTGNVVSVKVEDRP
jgi:RND family efflux transporter MFP subunit